MSKKQKAKSNWPKRAAVLAASLLLFVFAAWRAVEGLQPRVLPEGVSFYRPDIDFYTMAFHGEGAEKTLYGGGKEGFFALAGQDFARREDFPGTFVRAILSHGGLLYIGCEQGLYSYDGQAYTQIDPRRVQCLAVSAGGDLWAGTLEGAYRVRDGLTLTQEDGLADDYVNAMLPLPDGGLLMGSFLANQGGVTLWRDGAFYTFTKEDGLPHPYVSAFLNAGESVWVATGYVDRGGACRIAIDENGMTLSETLTRSGGLPGDKARSLYLGRDGDMWFGTEADGIAVFRDGQRVSLLTGEDYLPSNEVLCFLEDLDDEGSLLGLWLGTPYGCAYLNKTAIEAAKGANGT